MEAVMMGKRVMAEPVFSTVRIDDHLPANHLLRAVDALLDTPFVRRIMAPHYSLVGRPSIDPELMIRMLLVGYLGDRGRDAHHCAPPAQNRTGGIPAYGSHLGCLTANR
jgi:hypothetical protein